MKKIFAGLVVILVISLFFVGCVSEEYDVDIAYTDDLLYEVLEEDLPEIPEIESPETSEEDLPENLPEESEEDLPERVEVGLNDVVGNILSSHSWNWNVFRHWDAVNSEQRYITITSFAELEDIYKNLYNSEHSWHHTLANDFWEFASMYDETFFRNNFLVFINWGIPNEDDQIYFNLISVDDNGYWIDIVIEHNVLRRGVLTAIGSTPVVFEFDRYLLERGFSVTAQGEGWGGKWSYEIIPSQIKVPVQAIPSELFVFVEEFISFGNFGDYKEIIFPVYDVKGRNFFCLRDIAYLLNGTGAQFNIIQDSENNTISLMIGESYEAVGDEMSNNRTETVIAYPENPTIILDFTSADTDARRISEYIINNWSRFLWVTLELEVLEYKIDQNEETDEIFLNSLSFSIPTLNINGDSFFRLRDLSMLLQIEIYEWEYEGKQVAAMTIFGW